MRMITCFLDRPLVVILIWGFGLLSLLMIFWIFLILLAWSLGNFSLIFKVSLIMFPANKAWAYDFFLNFFPLGRSFFLKNLVKSLTFFSNFAGIGRGRDETKASFSVVLVSLNFSVLIVFSVNLDTTLFLRDTLFSTYKTSYPES